MLQAPHRSHSMPTLTYEKEYDYSSLHKSDSFVNLNTDRTNGLQRQVPLHSRSTTAPSQNHEYQQDVVIEYHNFGPEIQATTSGFTVKITHCQWQKITPQFLSHLHELIRLPADNRKTELSRLLGDAINKQRVIKKADTFPFFQADIAAIKNAKKQAGKLNLLKRSLNYHLYYSSSLTSSDVMDLSLALDLIDAIEKHQIPQKFPSPTVLLRCSLLRSMFDVNLCQYLSLKNIQDILIPSHIQRNAGSLDEIFCYSLTRYMQHRGNNCIVLELHAGNGWLSWQLTQKGIPAIATDACVSACLSASLIKDVYFATDYQAIEGFKDILRKLDHRGIPHTPYILASFPGTTDDNFFKVLKGLIPEIPNIRVITIGKACNFAYLEQDKLACINLTQRLNYVGTGTALDLVLEYHILSSRPPPGADEFS